MRQIIFTAATGLLTTLLLSGPAAAGDLKATLHTVAPGIFGGGGGGATGSGGTPGASGVGLPGDFGLPNFVGLGGDANGTSAPSDKLYVGSSSDGSGSYNIQIKKKILSF